MQLYSALTAVVMGLFSSVEEWPGQLISLFALTASGWVVFLLLRKQNSLFASVTGLLVFLSSLSVIHLSTSIQPDGFCFLFYILSFFCFYQFVEEEKGFLIVPSCIFASLAVLIKPPALHLGIIQFFWVFFRKPRYLKQLPLIINWIVIICMMALFYKHSHTLYLKYGNTFGIGLDGDQKYPSFHDLLNYRNYKNIFLITANWSVTYLGVAAGIYLFLIRRIGGIAWAFILGLMVHFIVSMRYSSSEYLGAHYHIFASFLGALLTSQAVDLMGTKRLTKIVLVSLVVITIFGHTVRRKQFHSGESNPYYVLGEALKRLNFNNEYVVIRSKSNEFVSGRKEKTVENYQDPRIMYVSGSKGWVIPADVDDPDQLVMYMKKGAKYYVEVANHSTPGIMQWLENNSDVVFQDQNGTIYQLR